jgi:hypothetical protein
MHWGIYSNLGCIESSPLVWADRSWANPSIQTFEELEQFRSKYWSQNRSLNPTNFNPQEWAKLARRAGMRYVVFTTKHHDGFAPDPAIQRRHRRLHAARQVRLRHLPCAAGLQRAAADDHADQIPPA